MEIYTILSIFSLLVAFGSTAVILVYIIRYPRPMKVMNAVWPLTTLWGGLAGLWAFFTFGNPTLPPSAPHPARPSAASSGSESGQMAGMPPVSGKQAVSDRQTAPGKPLMHMDMGNQPFWQKVVLSTFHCGAGCTLADLIGEWLGPFFLLSIGLRGIVWMWILDYILALLIGAYFQYAAIRPTLPRLSAGQVFGRAMKIDFLSLTSWQIGMYAFSYLVFFIILPAPLSHDSWTFWYTMQLAMCVGFLFSYPMNWYLIKKGIKPAM